MVGIGALAIACATGDETTSEDITSSVDQADAGPAPYAGDYLPVPDDSGTKGKDPTTKDSGTEVDSTTPPQDSAVDPPDTSVPTTDCDISTSAGYAKYFGEAALSNNAPPCPCSASECCYLGAMCLAR